MGMTLTNNSFTSRTYENETYDESLRFTERIYENRILELIITLFKVIYIIHIGDKHSHIYTHTYKIYKIS